MVAEVVVVKWPSLSLQPYCTYQVSLSSFTSSWATEQTEVVAFAFSPASFQVLNKFLIGFPQQGGWKSTGKAITGNCYAWFLKVKANQVLLCRQWLSWVLHSHQNTFCLQYFKHEPDQTGPGAWHPQANPPSTCLPNSCRSEAEQSGGSPAECPWEILGAFPSLGHHTLIQTPAVSGVPWEPMGQILGTLNN